MIFENEEDAKNYKMRKDKLLELIENEKSLLIEGETKAKEKHIELLRLKKERNFMECQLKKKSEKLVNISRRIEEMRNLEKDYLMRIRKVEKELMIEEDLKGIF